MLLDEAKTKRRVRIIAIITALAFVGTIIPVIALTLFQSDPNSRATAIEEALKATRAEPKNPIVWEDLSAAYVSGDNVSRADQEQAIAAARKAASLTPKADPARLERTQILASYLADAGKADESVNVLSDFTKANPKNAEGFLALGQQADQQGKSQLARISYERYISLAPTGASVDDVRTRLTALANEARTGGGTGGGIAVTPATP